MTLEDAKKILNECTRSELLHAFGDREVFWNNSEGHEVARGQFNFVGFWVSVYRAPISQDAETNDYKPTTFDDEWAYELDLTDNKQGGIDEDS